MTSRIQATLKTIGLLALALTMPLATGQTTDTETQVTLPTDDTTTPVLKINAEVITRQELNNFINDMIDQQMAAYGMMPGSLEPEKRAQIMQAMEKQARDQLVDRTLLEQLVEKNDDIVSPEEVAAEIDTLRARIQEQGGELDQFLQMQGRTMQDLRDEVEMRLTVKKIIEQEYGDLEPTQEAVQTYYEENREQFAQPEKIRMSHILFGYGEEAFEPGFEPTEEQKEALRQQAEETLTELQEGADFSELATELSDDPGSQRRGGDLGFHPQGVMVPPFEEAAWALEEGELSGVVETPFGFHIIKKTGHQEAKEQSLEEVADQIEMQLSETKFSEQLQQLLEDLREKAEVEVLQPLPAQPAMAPAAPAAEQDADEE